MQIQILKSQARLHSLFEKASSLRDDPELLGNWARYLCVLVAGHIENSVRILLIQYAKNKGSPALYRYVSKNLAAFRNPKMGRIVEVVSAFDADWALDLEQFGDGQIAESINSIVSNRHLIAHGRTSDISLVRLRDYFRDATKLIARLAELSDV